MIHQKRIFLRPEESYIASRKEPAGGLGSTGTIVSGNVKSKVTVQDTGNGIRNAGYGSVTWLLLALELIQQQLPPHRITGIINLFFRTFVKISIGWI